MIFDLALRSGTTDYQAQIIASPVGEARHTFTLPFREDELSALHTWRADAAWPLAHLSPQAVGTRLYESVFAGPIGEAFRRSQDAAQRDRQPLRIRLRMDEAPELAALPWELLYDPVRGQYLTLSEHTPLVRYLALSHPPAPIDVTPPLRMLVVTSSPEDMPNLDVETEWATFNTALAPLIEQGMLVVERLPQASWSQIQDRLRGEDVHILHFVGHGASDGQGEAGLVLVGEEGQPHWIDAAQFGALISDHRALRLVLLNACQGAVGAPGDVRSGVAQTLVRQGIPAVVAMQRPITDKQGIAFAREFYGAIVDGRAVDSALSEGRKAIYQHDDVAWATPVLFMRAEDGHLFRQVEETPMELGAPFVEPLPVPMQSEPAKAPNSAHQRNRRILFFFIATLSASLGNVIAGVANLNQTWMIALVAVAWVALLAAELRMTLVEDHHLEGTVVPGWLNLKFLFGGIAGIVVLAGAIIAVQRLWPSPPACPADQSCILVAQFSPVENQKAQEVTHYLTDEIQKVLGAYAQQSMIAVTARTVTDQQDAEVLAKQEGALVVVWGKVSDSEDLTTVYFELADVMGITESNAIRPYRVEPYNYQLSLGQQCTDNCMEFGGDLTRHAAVVANVAAGLGAYIEGHSSRAQRLLWTGLYCAGYADGIDLAAVTTPSCASEPPLDSLSPAFIHYYLGKSVTMQGSYRQGIEIMRQAAQANPQDFAARIGIASSYQNWSGTTKAEEAAAALDEAERIIRDLPVSYQREFYTGFVLELGGDYAGAAASYAEASRSAEGTPGVNAYNILIALGRAQRLNKDLGAAAQTLNEAVDLAPDAPWAYLELASVRQADRDEADRLLEQAASRGPDQPYVFITQGRLCDDVWKDLSCAALAYEEALKLRPGDGWLYNQLADVYRRKADNDLAGEDWQHAMEYAQNAVDTRPEDPWAHDRLGFIYAVASDYERAISHLAEAVDLAYSPASAASSNCNLGLAYELNEDTDSALARYRLCADHALNEQDRIWAEERIIDLSTAPRN